MTIDDQIDVLLVEDNPGDVRLIREMLLTAEDVRFVVKVKHSLTEALDFFGEDSRSTTGLSIVLLDLSLPDSWGMDTILALRKKAFDLPIVVLTGFDDQQQGILAMQAGAQDYLSKGAVDSRLLQRALRYAIERHRVENTLRRQTREIAALQERQRLARDLHDSVSQTLFTSSVMAESALRQWSTNGDKAHDLLRQSHQLMTSALAEMRILLLELRPQALAQANLNYLIEQVTEAARSRGQFAATVRMGALPALPTEIKIGMYRIVQEALNNIAKHAHAAHVDVTGQYDDGIISLQISDDGSGFDTDAVEPTSLGLSVMQERAQEIGATLSVQSAPGQGTQVALTWAAPFATKKS
jgi:signal transduction histidine kinase